MFSTIVSVLDALKGGVQVFFGRQKQWNPLLGSSLLLALKCLVANWNTLDTGKKR